ncbi:MAG: amidohydrolase family protein [Gemmatimonadota bacterium]|nr:amidohydrolase family protein [Gemmatimonadota bacterium]
MIRYHARWVLPVTRPPIENGTVAVDGERIAYVGARAGAPTGEDRELGNVLLMPGLVNAHTHLELTAMRGFLEELEFDDWVATLQRAKTAVLSPDDLLDAARLGVLEGVLAGVTTFADTCDSGVSLRAMRELGVRGIMYQETFGPDPEACAGSLDALRVKVEILRQGETPLVRLGVSPHAPYTVSDALFGAVAAYARRDALPLAIHIAESEAESRLVGRGDGPFAARLRQRGIATPPRARSPVALLARLGVLEAGPLLIHCVRVDGEDIAAIAAARCGVAHCPISNAKLGNGIAPLLPMLDAGIAVGLGSDSMASNDRMDLLEEARFASLAQRARRGRPDALPAVLALELATLGGARALGLTDRIGSLEPGKDADMVAFSLEDMRAVPVQDPATSAVFALGGSTASLVMVAGRVLIDRVSGRVPATGPGLAGRVARVGADLATWRRTERTEPR